MEQSKATLPHVAPIRDHVDELIASRRRNRKIWRLRRSNPGKYTYLKLAKMFGISRQRVKQLYAAEDKKWNDHQAALEAAGLPREPEPQTDEAANAESHDDELEVAA